MVHLFSNEYEIKKRWRFSLFVFFYPQNIRISKIPSNWIYSTGDQSTVQILTFSSFSPFDCQIKQSVSDFLLFYSYRFMWHHCLWYLSFFLIFKGVQILSISFNDNWSCSFLFQFLLKRFLKQNEDRSLSFFFFAKTIKKTTKLGSVLKKRYVVVLWYIVFKRLHGAIQTDSCTDGRTDKGTHEQTYI